MLAVAEARRAVESYPDRPQSYEMLIKALSGTGDYAEMMRVWGQFHALFPDKATASQVLEEMCWGVMRQGKQAHTLSARLISIIAAALTQDAYAIEFLKMGLRDSNTHIRSISVQLSALFRDKPLADEIERLFYEERRPEVRIEVMKAIGALRMQHLYEPLLLVIEDKKVTSEERVAAIQAILQVSESVDREKLEVLAADKKAGLRLLACEAIAKFALKEQSDILFRLIYDTNPQVAAAALRAIGLLQVDTFSGRAVADYVRPLTNALDPYVGVCASWVLLLHQRREAEVAFARWIFHEKEEVRAFAASAIAASGVHGIHAALSFLEKTTDPYVQANLALALVGQRVNCTQACEILDHLLKEHKERWMLDEGIFSPLMRSRLSHKPGIPNYPEVVNQSVRLEMINMLAILDYPGAHDAIKEFLKERRYGVTGLAAETLLGEGDETAIELVKEILDDPDKEIRLDAALVLATWGRDPSALPVLLEVYPQADRMLKIKILESLGRIGDKEAIPFLIERLKEPSQNLRMIAASVLIQTLNR